MSSNASRMSFSLNVSLPTMLIWRILARLPSTMSILILTRLPGDFLDLGVDARRVFAARAVLVLQERLHVLEHRAVEGLALRETDVAQRLAEVLGLDVLVALELEALDGRALVDHHDQRAAVAAQLDVAEEAGVVQRAHRLADALRRQGVADVDRQIVVDRSFGDALQTFDADVADGERRPFLGVQRARPAESRWRHKESRTLWSS